MFFPTDGNDPRMVQEKVKLLSIMRNGLFIGAINY